MKRKIATEQPVTKADLRTELQNYPTKADLRAELQKYPTKADLNTALLLLKTEVRSEMQDVLTQFRSDMFTRFDQIMKELAQMREDTLFRDYDIEQLKAATGDHAKRIKILETDRKILRS